MRQAAFICSEELWAHGHGDAHPLRAERLRMTSELLRAYEAFDQETSHLIPPTPATNEELALWHTTEYIDAVHRLSDGDKSIPPWKYHFGPGDNPVFSGMYETEALKAGSTLLAAKLVLQGQVDVAFSFAGGLHHAMAGHASGFCVFNDPAIAIQWLVDQDLRVAYVDIDAHHGDGVQAAFYGNERVMTISLHESGRYLFPGTGFVDEIGSGASRGLSVNLPLLPYSGDEVYQWAFAQVVPPVIERFAPDVLLTQLGVDTHYLDPLTHLQLTTAAFGAAVRSFRGMDLPWVAMGGGGYNVNTVARAWTMAYGIMSDQVFPDEIPAAYTQAYGDHWLSDHEQPDIPPRVLDSTRRHAEEQVAALKARLRL
jgi:acetoin utilization protein AcuC